MEGESGVTRSIVQGDEMKVESGVIRNIIDELHSWDIQGDQMEDESNGVTRSIIDELNSWDVQGDQMEGESMVLLEVSLMNFTLGISKEIKRKVMPWCYSKYH